MEGSDDASARARQFEFLNCEWELLIIRVVNQEAMEDVLLDAFRVVTRRNQRTSGANIDITFFNTSSLRVLDAIRLDVVDDCAPFAIDVDGTERADVSSGTRTKVSLIV
jgi:hypothetical protein